MNKTHTDNGIHNTKKHPILPLPAPRPPPKEFFVRIPDVTYALREI